MTGILSAQQVRASEFDLTRFRKGYEYESADALLDRIADALDGTTPMSAQEVRTSVMPVVRIRPGYDMGQVDELLDRAAAELERREAVHRIAVEAADPAV